MFLRGAIEAGYVYMITKQLMALWIAEGAQRRPRSHPLGRPRPLVPVRRSKTGISRAPVAMFGMLAAAALQWQFGLRRLRHLRSTQLALLMLLPPALYAASAVVTASTIVGVEGLSAIRRGCVAQWAGESPAELKSEDGTLPPTTSPTSAS